MDIYEMAHRWCNCDFGKKGGYSNRGYHVSCNEEHFYSYSTVYAMWLDKTPGKQLMVIMDHGCSQTSNKHLWAIRQAIPESVKFIKTHMKSYWYGSGYANVEFGKNNWQVELPLTILGHLKTAIEPFKDSKTVGTRKNLEEIRRMSDDINWLYDNRKDCKVKDINIHLKDKYVLKKIFTHVRKECTPEELVDIILGDGTYAAYDARLAPQKKAEKTRRFVAWFHYKHNLKQNTYTKKEIDKMPISEKVRLACLPSLQDWEINNRDWTIVEARKNRFAAYLLGEGATASYGTEARNKTVTNRFTGEKYKVDLTDRYDFWSLPDDKKGFAWHARVSKEYSAPFINLSEYKKLQNKDQWLKRFYQKCAIISQRQNELLTWIKMQFYTEDKLNQCSEVQFAQYNRVQLKFSQYMADQEACRLAEEKERQRMEEEKKRLEEERKLKYDSYVARGIEGYRGLYYEKLDSISVSRQFGDEFFFGGNVLLRWRTNELIETSKNIIITIPQAKKIFKVISKWHEDPSKFEPYRFITNSGDYNANSYKNDMLTAGCHKIAYCEMERMYNEILKRETA